jgi:hypothetical protein
MNARNLKSDGPKAQVALNPDRFVKIPRFVVERWWNGWGVWKKKLLKKKKKQLTLKPHRFHKVPGKRETNPKNRCPAGLVAPQAKRRRHVKKKKSSEF